MKSMNKSASEPNAAVLDAYLDAHSVISWSACCCSTVLSPVAILLISISSLALLLFCCFGLLALPCAIAWIQRRANVPLLCACMHVVLCWPAPCIFLARRLYSVKHYVWPLYNNIERTDGRTYHHHVDHIQFAHSCTAYVGLAQARPNKV